MKFFKEKTSEDNWVCKETLGNKLKICVRMLETMMGRIFNSTYEIAGEKESVNENCEEEQVTFFEPIKDEDSEFFDPTEITIGVWMFKCPITKMQFRFPSEKDIPSREIMQEFYITKGKSDETPIIAVLKNSTFIDNICLKNMYILNNET